LSREAAHERTATPAPVDAFSPVGVDGGVQSGIGTTAGVDVDWLPSVSTAVTV
jgi:hypothetical protein